MSIWEYRETSDSFEEHTILEESACPFCQSPLMGVQIDSEDLPKHWVDTYLTEESPRAMGKASGPRDDLMGAECEVRFCSSCGWWSTVLDVTWKYTGEIYGAGAALRNLDLEDISIPLQEVQDYLLVQNQARFNVSPHVFEDVVGSVFSNLGYKVVVTGKTGDGGIDAIMQSPTDQVVGVQVKRYKDSIEAEQIRSFLGALVLGGFTKGVYVTTSKFRRGAHAAAAKAEETAGLPIELYDADRFLDALRIAQKSSYRDYDPKALVASIRHLNYAGGDAGWLEV